MADNTSFSIIIPTYNRGIQLLKCIQNIIISSKKSEDLQVEIIVSDDGIHEITKEQLINIEKDIRLIQGPGNGPASNRNFGASNAKNDWLIFLDDDCLPSVNIVNAYHLAISQYPHCFAFEGKIVSEEKITSPLQFSPVNLNGGAFWSCNIMIQKYLFFKLGGFDVNYPFPAMEDIDMKEKILNSGNLIHFVKEAWVDHPPRTDRTPKNNAMKHESIYYYYLKNNKSNFLLNTIRIIAEDLYQRIKKFTFHPEIISKIYYTVIEIICLCWFYIGWKKKYKNFKTKF